MTTERLFLVMRYAGHRPSSIANLAWWRSPAGTPYWRFSDEFDEPSGQWRLVQYVEGRHGYLLAL